MKLGSHPVLGEDKVDLISTILFGEVCDGLTESCAHLVAGQLGEDAKVGLLPAHDTVCVVVQELHGPS
eukprot:4728383-Amphidinium_carterae.2